MRNKILKECFEDFGRVLEAPLLVKIHCRLGLLKKYAAMYLETLSITSFYAHFCLTYKVKKKKKSLFEVWMMWGVHVPCGTKYKPSCRLFVVVIIIIILKQMHTWIAIHNQREEINSTGQILKLDKTREGLEVEFYHVWRKYYKNPDMYAKVENCFAFPLAEHFFFIVISSSVHVWRIAYVYWRINVYVFCTFVRCPYL